MEIKEGQGRADGYPLKIEELMKTLAVLKDMGATHVELDYHCDHIGYDISGYNIRPAYVV